MKIVSHDGEWYCEECDKYFKSGKYGSKLGCEKCFFFYCKNCYEISIQDLPDELKRPAMVFGKPEELSSNARYPSEDLKEVTKDNIKAFIFSITNES